MDKLLAKLRSNNMQGYLARSCEEAKSIALGLIPKDAVIAMGNSLTLRETGIFAAITTGGFKIINQFEPGISAAENLKRRKEGLQAEVYFTSTNAITAEGELVNIDGKGNRVAAMMFGPDKVIVIVGANKIVQNLEAAWQRLKEKTAPQLAKKLGRTTPCAITGACSNCSSPDRICRCYSVIGSQMPADKDRIHVIIVEEALGI